MPPRAFTERFLLTVYLTKNSRLANFDSVPLREWEGVQFGNFKLPPPPEEKLATPLRQSEPQCGGSNGGLVERFNKIKSEQKKNNGSNNALSLR